MNERVPDDYVNLDEVFMSNSDHSIDKVVEKKLIDVPSYAGYAGWNFYGVVWYEDDLFKCEVWVYGGYKETIMAETTEELMEKVSAKFGRA